MTTDTMRVCPIANCGARVRIASEDELVAGQHLWQCTNGHHGPAVIGYHGYAEH